MEKRVRMALLLDLYGGLLTDQKLLAMQAYYEQDLSLAEIAENQSVSRQCVHDALRRAEAQLEDAEEKLRFLNREGRNRELLLSLRGIAGGLSPSALEDEGVRRLVAAIGRAAENNTD